MFEGSGEKKQNNAGKKEKKEGTSSEEKIGKIDEIFDELLDKVKDAPEAQQEALKILIGQMRQIGEQLKQVRDMKNLQEIKTLMMKNWKELEELAGDDPKLLKTIQDWGKKFIEEKVIYYELIGDVKDELIDKAQEVQESWDDMLAAIGKITGLVGSHMLIIQSMMNIANLGKEGIFKFRTGLEKFITNATDPENHYFFDNLDLEEANKFLENVGGVIMVLSKDIAANSDESKRAEAEAVLNKLIENKKIISRNIKDTSKIFKVIKKVRDTHFLPLYNEQPEQIAA